MNEQSNRVERTGAPAFAGTQRDRVLGLLRQAGHAGLSRERAIFSLHITQVGTRISELIEMGYKISSRWAKPEDRYVTYYLDQEPATPLPFISKYKKHSSTSDQAPAAVVESSTASTASQQTLFTMQPQTRTWRDPDLG